MSVITASTTSASISPDQAVRIAQGDASKVYDDLAPYQIVIAMKHGAWHVDYELTDPQTAGGGPHYVIDPTTGTILSKRYEQ